MTSDQRGLADEEKHWRLLAAMEEEGEKHRRLMAEAAQTMARAKQAYDHLVWVVAEIKRQRQKDFYQPLHEAIDTMHRCRSLHAATFAVRKVAEGKTIWEGNVEEFQLVGHRRATSCYAWYYQEWGRVQTFSLLKLPPVHSPHNAVQLVLAARNLPPLIPF